MRQRRTQPWKVEIAPRAWNQLGVVPADVFHRIQNELEAVAEVAGDEVFDATTTTATHGRSLMLGQWAAIYRLDSGDHRVVLEEVARRLEPDASPVEDDPAPTPRGGSRSRKK
jgi:hypothetical protein